MSYFWNPRERVQTELSWFLLGNFNKISTRTISLKERINHGTTLNSKTVLDPT